MIYMVFKFLGVHKIWIDLILNVCLKGVLSMQKTDIVYHLRRIKVNH